MDGSNWPPKFVTEQAQWPRSHFPFHGSQPCSWPLASVESDKISPSRSKRPAGLNFAHEKATQATSVILFPVVMDGSQLVRRNSELLSLRTAQSCSHTRSTISRSLPYFKPIARGAPGATQPTQRWRQFAMNTIAACAQQANQNGDPHSNHCTISLKFAPASRGR